jgi:multidrug efflux pump
MLSQLLTLYTTPVIYLAFDRVAKRVTRRRAKQLVSDEREMVPGD